MVVQGRNYHSIFTNVFCALQTLSKFPSPPKVTELLSDKPRIQIQVCVTTNLSAVKVLSTLNWTILLVRDWAGIASSAQPGNSVLSFVLIFQLEDYETSAMLIICITYIRQTNSWTLFCSKFVCFVLTFHFFFNC